MESQVESQDLQAEPQKRGFTLSRNHFYLLLLATLLLPAVVVTCYGAEVRGIFFVALLSLMSAGGGGWYLLRLWEMKMQRSVSKLVKARLAQTSLSSSEERIALLHKELHETRRGYEHQMDLLQSSVAKSKEDVHQLNLEMDKKLEEMRIAYLEFEDLRKEYHRLEEEYAHAKLENQKQVKHRESLNSEYQRTIAEQRMILEKKQGYITKLEGKVHDLMYEIRSLLQLEETSNEPSVSTAEDYLALSQGANTPYDLSLQLQRYVEKAEEQTGMEHLGGKSPRFLDLADSYAVDRRGLFDCFSNETAGIIYILSLSEKKFLFVNPHVKALLGWSPEKFMKEFSRIVASGYPEWKKALASAGQGQEGQAHVVFQTKSGEKKDLMCVMGLIAKGPFSNHIMGILG
ncbi:MAG: hypothetical protein S4CHLAM2_13880 [Chlamydiales bacterium]|nr:hypothetical protein [Chlamydiales bacterium]